MKMNSAETKLFEEFVFEWEAFKEIEANNLLPLLVVSQVITLKEMNEIKEEVCGYF